MLLARTVLAKRAQTTEPTEDMTTAKIDHIMKSVESQQ
jgi:hypothetical protein